MNILKWPTACLDYRPYELGTYFVNIIRHECTYKDSNLPMIGVLLDRLRNNQCSNPKKLNIEKQLMKPIILGNSKLIGYAKPKNELFLKA